MAARLFGSVSRLVMKHSAATACPFLSRTGAAMQYRNVWDSPSVQKNPCCAARSTSPRNSGTSIRLPLSSTKSSCGINARIVPAQVAEQQAAGRGPRNGDFHAYIRTDVERTRAVFRQHHGVLVPLQHAELRCLVVAPDKAEDHLVRPADQVVVHRIVGPVIVHLAPEEHAAVRTRFQPTGLRQDRHKFVDAGTRRTRCFNQFAHGHGTPYAMQLLEDGDDPVDSLALEDSCTDMTQTPSAI